MASDKLNVVHEMTDIIVRILISCNHCVGHLIGSRVTDLSQFSFLTPGAAVGPELCEFSTMPMIRTTIAICDVVHGKQT
jgi:hypothetical protein